MYSLRSGQLPDLKKKGGCGPAFNAGLDNKILKAGSTFLLGTGENKCEAKSFLPVGGSMPKGMEHFHRTK